MPTKFFLTSFFLLVSGTVSAANCTLPKGFEGLAEKAPNNLGDLDITPKIIKTGAPAKVTFKIKLPDKGYIPGSLALDEVEVKDLSKISVINSVLHYEDGKLQGLKATQVAVAKDQCPSASGDLGLTVDLSAPKAKERAFVLRADFKMKNQSVQRVGSWVGLIEFTELGPSKRPEIQASIWDNQILFKNSKGTIVKKIPFKPMVETEGAGTSHTYLEEATVSSDATIATLIKTHTYVRNDCTEEGCGNTEQSIEVMNSAGILFQLNFKDRIATPIGGGVSPNGKLLLVSIGEDSNTGKLAVFDMKGKEILSRDTDSKDADFSPDGKCLAWKGDEFIEFVNLDSKESWKYKTETSAVSYVTYSYVPQKGFVVTKDGKEVATCPICKSAVKH